MPAARIKSRPGYRPAELMEQLSSNPKLLPNCIVEPQPKSPFASRGRELSQIAPERR